MLLKPESSIIEYPMNIALPTYPKFECIRSTINVGRLEQAIFNLETTKDNPFIVGCLMSEDNDGRLWCDCDIKAKVWGKVELHYLTWVNYSIFTLPGPRSSRRLYATSLRKYEHYKILKDIK